jgi:hypothetical protein
MKAEEWNPQMARRNADVFSSALICENLRHLRFNNSIFMETDKALKGILKKLRA